MDLDLYGLRVFCQVMQDKTFSRAARSLRVTQPNVSQQIGKLEEKLQGPLFQRVGHILIPTPLAQELYTFASNLIESVEDFSQKLQEKKSTPRGLVRYSMPESCQWTPHYRNIMSQIRELPELKFKIEICTNEESLKLLLEGQIDFGFIVGERVAPELRFQKFSEEPYVAVAAQDSLLKPFYHVKDLASLRLVTYPGWELFFETWAKKHGLLKPLKQQLAEPTVHVGTLAGAVHAIQEGAGVGIVPLQCVATELNKGQLKEWSSGKNIVALNPVYIAKRRGEELTKRAEIVLDMLIKSKKELG